MTVAPPPSLAFPSTCLKGEDLQPSGLVTICDKFDFSLKVFISKRINCLVLSYYYAIVLFPSHLLFIEAEGLKNNFHHAVSVIIKEAVEMSP